MGMVDHAARAKTTKPRILCGDIPRWIRNSKRARYITSVILSTPPWVDREALKALAYRAACLSEMTGVEHVLDHIVPLNHPRVCGLTVPWNLEVTTRKANGAKSNHFPDERQLEMFE